MASGMLAVCPCFIRSSPPTGKNSFTGMSAGVPMAVEMLPCSSNSSSLRANLLLVGLTDPHLLAFEKFDGGSILTTHRSFHDSRSRHPSGGRQLASADAHTTQLTHVI